MRRRRLRRRDDAGRGAPRSGVRRTTTSARCVKKHPTRFTGLATLPTANVAAAAEELLARASGSGTDRRDPAARRVHQPGRRARWRRSSRSRKSIAATSSCTARAASAEIPGRQAGDRRRESMHSACPLRSGNAALGRDAGRQRIRPHVAHHGDASRHGRVITLALTDFLDAYPDVTVQVAMMGGAIS